MPRASLLLALLFLPFSAVADDTSIAATIDAVTPGILEIRHHIHQNPELGNREFKTAALVADHLRALGFDEVVTGVAHTGVVGVLRGALPGPVIAVRADMDALPVTEEVDWPWTSTVREHYLDKEVGVSHACGHDVHTAVQLGVASVLAKHRESLAGTVKFIFQPAEEGPPPGEDGGAAMMVAEGVMEDPAPEAVFGLHTFSEMEVGKLGYTVGPAFAAVDHFQIEIHGKQAHGAAPHFSVDPIVLGAQAVGALQTIRSRNLAPLDPAVVTVGIFRGGERYNIIPEQVHLEGTVRTYSEEARDLVEKRMAEILDGVTRSGGGTYELDYQRSTPATLNDAELAARVAPSLADVVGEENVEILEPTMGGEDFAEFSRLVPGFYFRLGTAHPELGSGGHHTPTFRADDDAVPLGIRAMTEVLLDYLAGQ